MPTIIVRGGRERPIRQFHPWVFSGAIDRVLGDPTDGAVVDVKAENGEWLARGMWSSVSQIRVRLFTWDSDQAIDQDLLQTRIERAVDARRPWLGSGMQRACRLIFAEADELPGLIVDQYGDYLVVQLLTQGMAARSAEIVAILADVCDPRGIYERSDADVREKEGLPPAEGVLWGEAPPPQLGLRSIAPVGLTPPVLLADLRSGQKTGFYLDQALNRARVAAYCHGREVLDCFCYTGGFSAYAAAAGAAQITAADTSAPALALVRETIDYNELRVSLETVEADIFQLLRRYRAEGRKFDTIILDPPKFAHSQGQVERAARGYKDINMVAMQLIRPGGFLATFSCSGLVSSDLFQKIVFGAAVDARRSAQIVERLSHPPDHPVLLTFPESEYLKGLICRVW